MKLKMCLLLCGKGLTINNAVALGGERVAREKQKSTSIQKFYVFQRMQGLFNNIRKFTGL